MKVVYFSNYLKKKKNQLKLYLTFPKVLDLSLTDQQWLYNELKKYLDFFATLN